MYAVLDSVMPHVPRNKPVHLLGIGDVPSILRGAAAGIDTFDSAYPTRSGRHAVLLTEYATDYQGRRYLFYDLPGRLVVQ
jgi:queuine tRNA-ribosyltransferase